MKNVRTMRTTFLAIIAAFALISASAQDVAQMTGTKGAPEKETERLFHDGQSAYNAGRYANAIELFTHVLQRDPENLNAYLQRGFCHSLQQEYEAAIADFSSVIQRKNDHLWAYTSRGSAYNKLSRFDKAIQDFDQVIALDAKNEEAYNNRGWSKKGSGDLEGACKDWKASKKMGNAEAKIILTNNRCK